MIINASSNSLPIADACIDAVVTDPPYGLKFMGKSWDYELPSVEVWEEVFRVMKPGAHLLAFGGSRTYHRAVCRIEDAGFEIRDCVMWIYGSGFPKSLDVSKAIDREAGAEREDAVKGGHKGMHGSEDRFSAGHQELKRAVRPQVGMGALTRGTPVTDLAKQWEGWGTALKPSYEPIVLARKPLDGTVAENVLEWGCGAINVDGCRIESEQIKTSRNVALGSSSGGIYGAANVPAQFESHPLGRWPANVIHDGSDEVVELFPVSKDGVAVERNKKGGDRGSYSGKLWAIGRDTGYGGEGSAARFFYTAKASRNEREAGLDGMEEKHRRRDDGQPYGMNTNTHRPDGSERRPVPPSRNHHPTVKPLALMRYLCRLITPPNGLILDPFFGSGSTGVAAQREGFRCIGIELSGDYSQIARARNEHEANRFPLFAQL